MARLRGHATDRPGRWKEPRAFAATDHTAQRAHQGRGRRHDPSTCQRAVWRRGPGGGKSDPSRARDTRADDRDDRGGLPDCARWRWRAARTDRRRAAVRHADEQYAWPRSHDGADREEAVAEPTGFLAKRRVHDVGAATRSDWTRPQTVAQQRRLARSVGASRRSPRVWRYQLQALTSI